MKKTVIFILCVLLAIGCTKRAPDEEIRIGAIVSLTGAAGEQGKNWLRGVQLAVAHAAQKGKKVRLVVEDDQTEPMQVVSAFTKLAQVSKVHGIIGGTWDYLGEAAYPLAQRYKIPFITPSNPPEVMSESAKKNPFVFSNSLTLHAMKKAAEQFIKSKNIKTISLVYPNLPFGQRQAEIIEDIAKENNISVVYRYEFPVSATMRDNVKLAALKLNEFKPDLIFAVLDYNGLDLLTIEFASRNYFPELLTTQHLDQAFIFSKDPARYKSMYAIYPKTDHARFVEEYRKLFPDDPKVFAEHGYDAVMLFIAAKEKGIDLSSPGTQFEYQGYSGMHVLPAQERALVQSRAVIMTTRNGKFEELN